MGLMVSEIYDAFLEAGVSKSTARAAAEAIPATESLATKQDLARLEARLEIQIAETRATVWKAVIAGAGLVVVLNRFLDWAVKQI